MSTRSRHRRCCSDSLAFPYDTCDVLLGCGGGGAVFLAQHRLTGERVAVKRCYARHRAQPVQVVCHTHRHDALYSRVHTARMHSSSSSDDDNNNSDDDSDGRVELNERTNVFGPPTSSLHASLSSSSPLVAVQAQLPCHRQQPQQQQQQQPSRRRSRCAAYNEDSMRDESSREQTARALQQQQARSVDDTMLHKDSTASSSSHHAVVAAAAAVVDEVSVMQHVGTHAHLVQLHAHHVTRRGVTFYAMELMSSDVARELRARNTALSREEVCTAVAYSVLRALAHLHACGVAHRDVKPANVLLRAVTTDEAAHSVPLVLSTTRTRTCAYDNNTTTPLVKAALGDLGAAHRIEDDDDAAAAAARVADGGDAHARHALALRGTLHYKAPEQLLQGVVHHLGTHDEKQDKTYDANRRNSDANSRTTPATATTAVAANVCGSNSSRSHHAVDYTRCDMWALGCTLYEMCSGGVRPFAGDTALQRLRSILCALGSSFVAYPARTHAPTLLTRDNDDDAAQQQQQQQQPMYTDGSDRNGSSNSSSSSCRTRDPLAHASPALRDLLRRLLALDPARRATAREALAHPVFASLRARVAAHNNNISSSDDDDDTNASSLLCTFPLQLLCARVGAASLSGESMLAMTAATTTTTAVATALPHLRRHDSNDDSDDGSDASLTRRALSLTQPALPSLLPLSSQPAAAHTTPPPPPPSSSDYQHDSDDDKDEHRRSTCGSDVVMTAAATTAAAAATAVHQQQQQQQGARKMLCFESPMSTPAARAAPHDKDTQPPPPSLSSYSSASCAAPWRGTHTAWLLSSPYADSDAARSCYSTAPCTPEPPRNSTGDAQQQQQQQQQHMCHTTSLLPSFAAAAAAAAAAAVVESPSTAAARRCHGSGRQRTALYTPPPPPLPIPLTVATRRDERNEHDDGGSRGGGDSAMCNTPAQRLWPSPLCECDVNTLSHKSSGSKATATTHTVACRDVWSAATTRTTATTMRPLRQRHCTPSVESHAGKDDEYDGDGDSDGGSDDSSHRRSGGASAQKRRCLRAQAY